MAVTAWWYANAFEAILDVEVDYLADTINVTLHTVTYTPNQDTHDYFDDLTNELTTSNGYTALGEALGTKTHDNTLNVSEINAADTVWTSSGAGFTASIAVTHDRTPASDATRPLLWWMDFGTPETASGGGTFTIQYGANIATITAVDATGFPA